MAIKCPICGELTKAGPGDACEHCWAVLPHDLFEADEEPPARVAAESADAASPELQDEMIAAFRAQFEEHRVHLPAKWIEHLRALISAAEESRRFATIFFVDLRGYSELSRLLTEKQLTDLLQWFYGMCGQRISEYGGFLVETFGDAVMAAFGAPWAFERDSESAMRALLAIREDVRRKGTFAGHPIAVRAGADFGALNVRLVEIQGRKRLSVTGTQANLAARLQDHAGTLDILISENMAGQIGSAFELEKREPFEPKNIGRLVTPYAVIGHKAGVIARRRQDIPFTGREAESAVLERAAAAVSSGGFAAYRISGEAGIGKTRLAWEFLARAQRKGMRTAQAWCEPHDRLALFQTALRLLSSAVISAAPGGEQNPHTNEWQFLAIQQQLPDLDPCVIPVIGYLLGIEPHLSRVRDLPQQHLKNHCVAALCSILHGFSARAPIIIFIDDLQWADSLSLEVVDAILKARLPGVFLLSASRSDSHPQEFVSPEAVLSLAGWEEIALAPLQEDARDRLIGHVLDMEAIPGPVKQRLFSQAEGNPFYLIELGQKIAAEAEEGFASLSAECGSAAPESRLPVNILDVLQARIDALPVQKRAIIQCGAILGRRFSFKVLALYEEIQQDLLAELYALKGLRTLRDEPLPEDIQFIFTPSVLRDIAYQTLTHEQKERLHGRIAELIESRFSDRLGDFTYDLAFHWTLSGKVGKACQYFRQAAVSAMVLLPQDALALARRALALLSPEPEKAGETIPDDPILLQRLAMMHELAGKACRMLACYDEADLHQRKMMEYAQRTGNANWIASAKEQLAVNAAEQGNYEECRSLLDEVMREAKPDSLDERRACTTRMILHYRQGNLRAALDEGLQLAARPVRNEREEMIAGDAWGNSGLFAVMLGEYDQGYELLEKGLEIWNRRASLYGQSSVLCNMGMTREKQGRLQEALACYEQAARISEQVGFFNGLSAVECNRANISLLCAEWQTARQQASRALKYAKTIRNRHSEAVALTNLGLALGELGFYEEASEALDEALRLGEQLSDCSRRASAECAKAWLRLKKGDGRATDRISAMPDMPVALRTWRDTLARASESLGAGTLDELFEPARLDAFRNESTLEDYLRRVDALALLCARGIVPERAAEARARRQEAVNAAVIRTG